MKGSRKVHGRCTRAHERFMEGARRLTKGSWRVHDGSWETHERFLEGARRVTGEEPKGQEKQIKTFFMKHSLCGSAS